MVRGGKKDLENAAAEVNPDAEERKRRKSLAFSKGILSDAPAKAFPALSPSKTVTKHHGRDILRKSQRKNRFLFSFPGLLAPISGGKIGELKDLGTKNPVLYIDFPQGQMKLFGTIVYPKNRYLTLQFSRGGKNVMCEDYFDTMIVFSETWWIGTKDENPEEACLEFPRELHEAHQAEYDFKGGAGAASETKQGVNKSGLKYIEQESPITDIEDDSSGGQNKLEDLAEVTPIRHSERTAGKRFNFAEASSGDDFAGNDVDTSVEDKKGGVEHLNSDYTCGKIENSCSVIFDIDNEDAAVGTHLSGQVQSAMLMRKLKEISHSNHSSLVQPTISSLFKKVEDKKAPRNLRKSPSSKASSQNLQHVGSEIKTNKVKDDGPRKKGKVIEDSVAGSKKAAEKEPKNPNSVEPVKVYQRKTKTFTRSTTTTPVKGQTSRVRASKLAVPVTSSQVEGDDIEEFSSTSKESDGSDEDWDG